MTKNSNDTKKSKKITLLLRPKAPHSKAEQKDGAFVLYVIYFR